MREVMENELIRRKILENNPDYGERSKQRNASNTPVLLHAGNTPGMSYE